MKQLVICLYSSLLLCYTADAQEATKIHPLSIGDTMPGLVLRNVYNYNTSELRLSSLKGKFIILDFWNTSCGGCLDAFPRMDALQKQMGQRIQVMLVNTQSQEEIVKQMKSRTSVHMPDLPSVTSDTMLNRYFPHIYVPHHVWIDGNGVVVAITHGYNSTASKITDILNGRKLAVAEKTDIDRSAIHRRALWNYEDTSLAKFVQNVSFFTRYIPKLASLISKKDDIDSLAHTIRNTYMNTTYARLLKVAYSGPGEFYADNINGNFYNDNRIIWNIRDSVIKKEQPVGDIDNWQASHLFNYEQILPDAGAAAKYKYMQEDLNRYFGDLWGVTANLEKRSVKCLIIRRTSNNDKLATRGGRKDSQVYDQNKPLTKTYINTSLAFVISEFRYNMPALIMNVPTPLLNETAYKGNVDIVLDEQIKSLPELKKQLLKYDLDLVQEYRQIDMLVIKQK